MSSLCSERDTLAGEGDAAGFQLAHLQDVIDEGEQMLCCRLHLFLVFKDQLLFLK